LRIPEDYQRGSIIAEPISGW